MNRIYTNLIVVAICLLGLTTMLSAQNLGGTISALSGQTVQLVGYSGFDTYLIDSTRADASGSFQLSFREEDPGVCYLLSENNESLVIIMGQEEIRLQGEGLAKADRMEVVAGRENQLFQQYASEHPRREKCLNAWKYLAKIYELDTLFAVQETPTKAIEAEQSRIITEDSLFLASLPTDSYIKYYLPLRKLVSSVRTVAQFRPEEIPATVAAFRSLDYRDPRMYRSGLLKEVIESHFWLLENSGPTLDSVYLKMQTSIDLILENLKTHDQKRNEISEYLFKLLEQRSLFAASEYLALTLLNETSCTLNEDFVSQLESYRAMKKGNLAPDILFSDHTFTPGYSGENVPTKLSDIQSPYKVVVFGASWCPQCAKEMQEINDQYANWRTYGVEVVFISLDDDREAFINFIEPFSFVSSCDFKKWNGPTVKDYHIFATPTIYLLNSDHEIILRPNSVSHLNSWIDWYLVQGNQ